MLYSNRNLNFNVEMIILLVNRNQLLLYAVTDSRWLGNKTLAQAVEEAIKGGVTFVQIREKEASYDEFKKIAIDVKKVTDKYNVPMIINDNVELAKDIDADGVHVGGDDMSVANARKILENHSQYEILLEIKDDEKIRAYCNETIGPIIKYDKAHNTNLYQTLKCYFDNNASVNKASAQMFIHRNTINYKIKKIEHILSCDLSSFEERFTLMLAIKLLEMYA